MAKNEQALLPMVELSKPSKLAVDELNDVLGRAQVEAVLRLSAERIAGTQHAPDLRERCARVSDVFERVNRHGKVECR